MAKKLLVFFANCHKRGMQPQSRRITFTYDEKTYFLSLAPTFSAAVEVLVTWFFEAPTARAAVDDAIALLSRSPRGQLSNSINYKPSAKVTAAMESVKNDFPDLSLNVFVRAMVVAHKTRPVVTPPSAEPTPTDEEEFIHVAEVRLEEEEESYFIPCQPAPGSGPTPSPISRGLSFWPTCSIFLSAVLLGLGLAWKNEVNKKIQLDRVAATQFAEIESLKAEKLQLMEHLTATDNAKKEEMQKRIAAEKIIEEQVLPNADALVISKFILKNWKLLPDELSKPLQTLRHEAYYSTPGKNDR